MAGLIALSATLAGAAPIGPNRVAVVLFNFQNDTRELITPAQADGVVFTNPDSAAAYWEEVSLGAITLSGDVYGWVTIAQDNQAPCPFDLWAQWMAAAVVAAGVNEADYHQILFSFPPAAGCLDCGISRGDRRTAVTTNNLEANTCITHELGHNFGLSHAWGYRCRDPLGNRVPISADCTEVEYIDWFDIMGFAFTNRHLSNFRKAQLGFLPPAEFPAGSVKTVRAPGTFTLASSEEPLAGQIQVLRVPRTVGADCSVGDYYYLEFRQPYGLYFDDFVPADPAVNGVTVRIARSHLSPARRELDSILIDTTADSASDMMDAPLLAGRTFTDPLTGVSVHTAAVAPAGATVQVSPPALGDADGDGFVRCLDTCPATANADQADADGDGLGDACDICTTSTPGQAWVRARIAATALDGQPGNDRSRIRARFTLASGSFSVDPLANGARIQLRKAAGEPALDVTLPSGAFVAPGPGWTASAAGTQYTFKDGRPGGTGGVSKMVVKDRGDGEVQITIVFKNATLGLAPTDAPIQATVVLGGAAAGAAGECGEVRFPLGQCIVRASAINCR